MCCLQFNTLKISQVVQLERVHVCVCVLVARVGQHLVFYIIIIFEFIMYLFVLQQLDLNLTGLNPLL